MPVTGELTAGALARHLSARLEGDGDRRIDDVAPARGAGPGDLTFVSDPRYAESISGDAPAAVLLPPDLEVDAGDAVLLRVENPELAFARAVRLLLPDPDPAPGVDASARVDAEAELGPEVGVGPFAVIGAGATVGGRSLIGPHAVVEGGAELGSGCRVGAGATVHGCARLGDDVVLGPGSRVGSDGYGFTEDEEGQPVRVPHVGGCRIGDGVEIGANSTVDRGSLEDTVIGAHTKIDNLVHVGHNVRVGRGCMIVAQVGVAGSARIGDGVQLGGQAGVSGHLEIGDGARIAAQAGVIGDVPAGEDYSGYPARPHRRALRASAAQLRLPELMERVRRLEDRIDELESEGET